MVTTTYDRFFLTVTNKEDQKLFFHITEHFSIECPKYPWDWIGVALLLSVISLENSRHSLNQSDAKLNNHDLVTCVFPCFVQFGWCHIEFSLALKDLLITLVLGFMTLNWKAPQFRNIVGKTELMSGHQEFLVSLVVSGIWFLVLNKLGVSHFIKRGNTLSLARAS